MTRKPKLNMQYVLPLTPSERKVICGCINNPLWNVLYITRSNGKDLIVEIERKGVRQTTKHEPPFKYQMRYYNKWGKLNLYRAGNKYNFEDSMLIDDFTEIDMRR